MPLSFKQSLRGFLASVRSSVMENSSVSLEDPVKRILSHQHATTWPDVVFSHILKCDDGLALLSALQNDYRICKASHFKKRPRRVLQDLVEHEFVAIHLRYKGKVSFFRVDRSIGPRSEKDDDNNQKPQGPPATTASSGSLVPSHTPSSRASSMNSILMSPSRLVDYCLCQLSSIAPNRHWARDTIVQIPQIPGPSDAYEVTTIEFTGSSSAWPSLWDLVHMVQFLNQECEEYNLMDAQCYWYADMVSALLEEWCPDTKVTRHHGWQGTRSKTLIIPAPGTFKGLPVYKRNPRIVQDKKPLLLQKIKSSVQSTIEFLDLTKGGDQMIRRVQEDADRQIDSLRGELREAEARVKAVEERADAKAREADAQIRDLSAQLCQSQEQLKKFEARVSDSDALMARIVARLDDFKTHGLPSIIS